LTPLRLGITCHAGFGGSGVIATELGLALAERGHDVHFICAHAPPRLVEARHVTLHAVQTPSHALLPDGEYALALASRLAEVSRAESLQLLHAHYALPHATSLWLARELLDGKGPKLVTTVHGTDVLTLGLDPAFKPIVRLSLLRGDALTAPSRFLAHAAREGLALGAAKVELIPNFVDTARFKPGPARREALFPDAQRKVLTHSSNFRALKRVEDVVRIFARVQQQVPCALLLIGDGPERPAVERLIHQLELAPWVKLLGEQREVVWMLQSSDVFLLPSALESFGLAALEAMACGVPVVASAVGGLPEVVTDGVSGFLRPVGDVEAMAERTVALLKDEALHQRLASGARDAAVRHWQRGPMVDAYEALYARLLGADG
jgi:N-acetyl-alpha-D-glucosaminyl L-malate synthase BshA